MNKIEYELDVYRSMVHSLRELSNAMASTIRYNMPEDENYKDFDNQEESHKQITFDRLNKHSKILETQTNKLKDLKKFMEEQKQ